ncbi:hypothetical protein HDU97_002307 [Phlyctochytrium planicorne]|nr:hypothetical protein HDU97_002307 [Phlyctochytrium planicorne]
MLDARSTSPSLEESLWNDALALNIAGDSGAALAIFGGMTRNSLPLQINQAILSARSGDHLAAVEIITEALTNTKKRWSAEVAAVDPRLAAFGTWIRGIARADWGDEASALQDFQDAETIFTRAVSGNSVDLEKPFGIAFTLHLYEIKFNVAVCLWRMGLIDDSAQEIADARPVAVTKEHIEAFDEVLASGFDPPGCFTLPEDVLFTYPAELTVGFLSNQPPSVDDSASDASSDDVYSAAPRSIPPVPAIPEHIIAMSRKDTGSASTTSQSNFTRNNTLGSYSSTEGLSSVAAALITSSSPSVNIPSPISMLSKEQAEKEFAEAMAAAEAYRDSWHDGTDMSDMMSSRESSLYDMDTPSNPAVKISRRTSSMGLGLSVPPPSGMRGVGLAMIGEEESRCELTEDAEAESERPDIEDLSPPVTVVLPELSIRTSSSRSLSPTTQSASSNSSSKSSPAQGGRLKRSESSRVSALTTTSASFISVLSSVPSPASSTTTTATSTSNLTVLPILDVPMDLRGSLPGGKHRKPPPALPSTLSARSYQSQSSTTPTSTNSISPNTTLAPNSSPPTSASALSASSVTPTSTSIPTSILSPNSPIPQPQSATNSDASTVQILSPLPRASLAGPILKTMGVTYNKNGSLPGGVKRTPATLNPSQALSPTAVTAAASSANTFIQTATPPTTPSPTTKKRAESSAPTPSFVQGTSPTSTSSNPGLRPRATTIDSLSGQVPIQAPVAPPAAQSHSFMQLLQQHQLEQQRIFAQAQAQAQAQQKFGPRGPALERSLKPSASASVLPSHLADRSNSYDARGLKSSTSVSALGAHVNTSGPAQFGQAPLSPSRSAVTSPPAQTALGPPQFPSVAAVGSAGFHRPRAVTLDSQSNIAPAPTTPLPSTAPTQSFSLPSTSNSSSNSPSSPRTPNLTMVAGGGSPTLRPRATTLESTTQLPLHPQPNAVSPQFAARTNLMSPTSPLNDPRKYAPGQAANPPPPPSAAATALAKTLLGMKSPSPLSPSDKPTTPTTPTTPGSTGSNVSITIRSSSLGGNLPAPHPKWLAKQSPNATAPTSPPPTGSLPPVPTSPLSPHKEKKDKEKKLKPTVSKQQLVSNALLPPPLPAPTKPLPPTPKDLLVEEETRKEKEVADEADASKKDSEEWKRETITNLLDILDNLGEGGQTQFLAYADYLVALDEVLEKDLKDLKDVQKHKSFFTVCSEDDDDENEAVTNALAAPSSVSSEGFYSPSLIPSDPMSTLPREEELRLSRRLTTRSDAEHAPWSSIIDMIIAKRFSIPGMQSEGSQGGSEPRSAVSTLFRPKNRSSSQHSGDDISFAEEDESEADDIVAREFLRAFRRVEGGRRESHVSSLEFSESGHEDSPSAISFIAGEEGERTGGGSLPHSPPSEVSYSEDGSGEKSSRRGQATITASLLGSLVQEYLTPHATTSSGSSSSSAGVDVRPSTKRRFPVMSYLESDAGDTESSFSVEASLAYKARDLDSFYGDEVAAAGPDYRDSFSSFAASGFFWRYGDDVIRRTTTREKKNSPDGGDRDWTTTETARLPEAPIEIRREMRAPVIQPTTPASAPVTAGPLVWMGPWAEGPTFWNAEERPYNPASLPAGSNLATAFGSPTNSGSLGRHQGKAKETGNTESSDQHQQIPYSATPSEHPTASDASLLLLQALSVPDIESFLYVRFDYWGAYKRRWCILRDRNLYIVRAPTDLRLIAVLAIGKNTEILPDLEASKHLGSLQQQRYGFKVVNRGLGEEVGSGEESAARKQLDTVDAFLSTAIDGYEGAGAAAGVAGSPSSLLSNEESPAPGSSPVIHFATEHQLTVINWVGHLARSAKGEKRIGPRRLIPVKNKGMEPGRAPLVPGEHSLLLSGLLAKAGAHFGLYASASAAAVSAAAGSPGIGMGGGAVGGSGGGVGGANGSEGSTGMGVSQPSGGDGSQQQQQHSGGIAVNSGNMVGSPNTPGSVMVGAGSPPSASSPFLAFPDTSRSGNPI